MTMARQRMLDYLFPDVDRTFPGMRWANIALRTLHLIGIAGMSGAFLYAIPLSEWRPFFSLTLSSGFLLMLLAIWSNGIWLIQLRGVATIVKLVLLALALTNRLEPAILFTIIAISGVMAHAPGRVRYYLVFPVPRFN